MIDHLKEIVNEFGLTGKNIVLGGSRKEGKWENSIKRTGIEILAKLS